MKINIKLQNELQNRKLKIVKFLYNILLSVGIVATVINVNMAINDGKCGNLLITVVITIVLAYIRFRYIFINLYWSFHILCLILTYTVVDAILLEGTVTPYFYLITSIVIVSTSIVMSVRRSILYTGVFTILVVDILLLQNLGYLKYSVRDSTSDIYSTIVLLLLILIIAYIAYTGYSQIEHSYNKAYDYAKELKKLNQELEKKVLLRTRQLKESFERQAESVHTAAVIGGITQPMLHDLASPISALEGAVALIDVEEHELENFEDERKTLIKHAKESINQLKAIIENAKELMNGRKVCEYFSPSKNIDTLLFILRAKLQKGAIEVDVNIPDDIKLYGISSMFSRIVNNVIINAVEELLDSEKDDLCIQLIGEEVGGFFILEIIDNGRGISDEYIDKIFEPIFSNKAETNLGFGLAFVKDCITKYFDGEVSVTSNVGKNTKIILSFNKNK